MPAVLRDIGIMLVVLSAIAAFGAGWLFATAWLPFKLMEWWDERTRRRVLSGTEEAPDPEN